MSEKKTVLIIDDEADARAFAEAVVSDTGDFRVVTASDGDSGIAKAVETVPDLIILDVMMPQKNGFHVFAEIRQNKDLINTPVIMLTGVSERTGIRFSAEDMGEYLGAKPAAFLEKPVDPGKLRQRIKEALSGSE